MTAGNLAWWHAMLGANQFEDGSLVIQDDTLDVTGGGTVNLLVKLGAVPRSDVTVALSETSALISLGSTSLTFTPANWDTYQSVVVTGAGNRHVVTLGDGSLVEASRIQWNPPASGREIPASLLDGNSVGYARNYIVYGSAFPTSVLQGDMEFQISDADVGTGSLAGPDLISSIETSGTAITLGLAGTDYVFRGPDHADSTQRDTAEPYVWHPDQDALIDSFLSAFNAADATQRGATTLTLRDYTPGDATISLSASGPDEYSGVTDSATVSVS